MLLTGDHRHIQFIFTHIAPSQITITPRLPHTQHADIYTRLFRRLSEYDSNFSECKILVGPYHPLWREPWYGEVKELPDTNPQVPDATLPHIHLEEINPNIEYTDQELRENPDIQPVIHPREWLRSHGALKIQFHGANQKATRLGRPQPPQQLDEEELKACQERPDPEKNQCPIDFFTTMDYLPANPFRITFVRFKKNYLRKDDVPVDYEYHDYDPTPVPWYEKKPKDLNKNAQAPGDSSTTI
ncbi:hypothetical protein PG989_002979 [Apiospora arundinis]